MNKYIITWEQLCKNCHCNMHDLCYHCSHSDGKVAISEENCPIVKNLTTLEGFIAFGNAVNKSLDKDQE